MAQVAHEELQTDEGKDAQAEDSQDHHIRKLLHRLYQSAHNGLQACRTVAHTNHIGDAGDADATGRNLWTIYFYNNSVFGTNTAKM